MSLSGAFVRNPISGFLAATSIVLSAAYSIFLFNRISFGSYSQYLSHTFDVTRREFMLLLPLLIVTVLLGIIPNVILSDIHVSVTDLLSVV